MAQLRSSWVAMFHCETWRFALDARFGFHAKCELRADAAPVRHYFE